MPVARAKARGKDKNRARSEAQMGAGKGPSFQKLEVGGGTRQPMEESPLSISPRINLNSVESRGFPVHSYPSLTEILRESKPFPSTLTIS